MAVNKCFSQNLQSTSPSASGTFVTSQYAKATFAPGTTSTYGTLTLTSYSDAYCNNPVSGTTPITITLPAAQTGTSNQYGPFGTMSPCSSSFPGTTASIYNQGGLYSFNNKLEMEAMMSLFTQGTPGPVYATFADAYCSTENTNDPSGNQLPIYAQWSANGACTYSLLTNKFKTESCNSFANVANTGAYSNTWQGFSDPTCTNAITNVNTYAETDVRIRSDDCPLSCFRTIICSPSHFLVFFCFPISCDYTTIYSHWSFTHFLLFFLLSHAFIQKLALICRSLIYFSFFYFFPTLSFVGELLYPLHGCSFPLLPERYRWSFHRWLLCFWHRQQVLGT